MGILCVEGIESYTSKFLEIDKCIFLSNITVGLR